MTDSRPPDFSVVIPVGPGAEEIARLRDLLASLRAHMGSAAVKVLVIDDSPRPRRLEELWPGAALVRTRLWRNRVPDAFSAMTAGTIAAMQRCEGDFALKLDTDALIVGPFAERIRAALDADPTIGIVGAFDVTPDGRRRDWSMWPPLIRRTTWPMTFAPRTGSRPARPMRRPRAERAHARSVIRAATANPDYELGAHCLGGAYAVSRSLLTHAPGWDCRPWTRGNLSEDVVIGLLCAAAGLRMHGLARPGDPFAVAWKGLPADPEDLVARGCGIVHSLKSDEAGTEDRLRAWFQAHREDSARR